jgi:hypothetical protein
MMILMKGTQALVHTHPETESLCDPLNGKVAELL